MRTKKILYNALASIIPYIILGALGFIKIRVFIDVLSSTGNGYYQFINQIISYLFLVEAGFTSAVVFKLYKPFADDNKKKICEIFTGSRKIFKRIGTIIFGLIVIMVFLFPIFFVKEEGYVYSVTISFFLIASSYLIAYFCNCNSYAAVFCADQKAYLQSLTFNGLRIICDLLAIIFVFLFKNILAIALVIVAIKIIEQFIINALGKHYYPWLTESKKEDTSAYNMTKDLVWHQLGYLAVNNVDSILILLFMNPIMVSIYSAYNFVLRFLYEICDKIGVAINHSFGNVFAKEKKEKAYHLFEESTLLFIFLSFCVSLTFFLGIRGFVHLWSGQAEYVLSITTAIMFSLSLFLMILYTPLSVAISSNGLYKESKYYILISALVNFLLSILLIKPFGIAGILFATTLSFYVTIILRAKLVTRCVFKELNATKLCFRYLGWTILFLLSMILFIPIENWFLTNTNIVLLVVYLGLAFLFICLVIGGILYISNSRTRDLLERFQTLFRIILKGHHNEESK